MGFFKSLLFGRTARRPAPLAVAAKPRNPQDAHYLQEVTRSVNQLKERMVELDRRMAQLEARTGTGARPMAYRTRSHTPRPPKSSGSLPRLETVKSFTQQCKRLVDCLTRSRKSGLEFIESNLTRKIMDFEARLADLDRQYPPGSAAHQQLDLLVTNKFPLFDLAPHLLHLAESDLKAAADEPEDALIKAIENFAAFMQFDIIRPANGEAFNDELHRIVDKKSGGESMRGKVAGTLYWGYRRKKDGECLKKADICQWD